MKDPEFHRLRNVELLTKLFDHVHQKEEIQTEFVAKYKEWYNRYKNIFADLKSLEGKFCIPSPDMAVTKLAVNSVGMACIFIGILSMDSFLLFLGFLIPAFIGTVSFYLQQRSVEFVTKSTTTATEMLSAMKILTNRLQETKEKFRKLHGGLESENEPLELSQTELYFADFKTESVTEHLKKYVSYQNFRNGSVGSLIVSLLLAILSYDFTDRLTLVVTAVIVLTLAVAVEVDNSMQWLIKVSTRRALIDDGCENLLQWFNESCGLRKIVETPEGLGLVKVINTILTQAKLKCENVLCFVSAFYLVQLQKEFTILSDRRFFFETVFKNYFHNVEINLRSESFTDSSSLEQKLKNAEFWTKDDIKIRLRQTTPEDRGLSENCNLQVQPKEPILGFQILKEEISEDPNVEVHQQEPILTGQILKEEISEDPNLQAHQQEPIVEGQILKEEISENPNLQVHQQELIVEGQILKEEISEDPNLQVHQQEPIVEGQILKEEISEDPNVQIHQREPIVTGQRLKVTLVEKSFKDCSKQVRQQKHILGSEPLHDGILPEVSSEDCNLLVHQKVSNLQDKILGQKTEGIQYQDFNIPLKLNKHDQKVSKPTTSFIDTNIKGHLDSEKSEFPSKNLSDSRLEEEIPKKFAHKIHNAKFPSTNLINESPLNELTTNQQNLIHEVNVESSFTDIKNNLDRNEQISQDHRFQGTEIFSNNRATKLNPKEIMPDHQRFDQVLENEIMVGDIKIILNEQMLHHQNLGGISSINNQFKFKEAATQKLSAVKIARKKKKRKRKLVEDCSEAVKEQEGENKEQKLLSECNIENRKKTEMQESYSTELQSQEGSEEKLHEPRSAEPQSRQHPKENLQTSCSVEPQSHQHSKENLHKSCSAEPQSHEHPKENLQTSCSVEPQSHQHSKENLQKSCSAEPQSHQHPKEKLQTSCSAEPQSHQHPKENLQKSCSAEPQSHHHPKEKLQDSISEELQRQEHQKETIQKLCSAELKNIREYQECLKEKLQKYYAEPRSKEQAKLQKSPSPEYLGAELQKTDSEKHLKAELRKSCFPEHQGEDYLTADSCKISCPVDKNKILGTQEREKYEVGSKNKEFISVKQNQERLGDNNRVKINMHKICKSRIQNDEHLEISSGKFHFEKLNICPSIISEKLINHKIENISTTVDGNGISYDKQSFQTTDSETLTNTVAKNGKRTPKPTSEAQVLINNSIIKKREEISAERSNGEKETKNFNLLSDEQLDPSSRSTCIRESIKTLAHIRRNLRNMTDKISLLILNIDNY